MWPGPSDLFKTKDAAAKDFGITYNGQSIKQGQEYGSTVYVVIKDGKTYYTYSKANTGGNASVVPCKAPKGSKSVADIHSHGKYEPQYDNNNFSPTDKADNDRTGLDGYLTTPDGSLKKYETKTKTESVVSTDLPSDPNDPARKNKVSPEPAPAPAPPSPEKPKPVIPPVKKTKETEA